ncbi:cytochrome P450 [Actinomadura sp. SCN-SB]|uniref:cytochrome P450 n=1 Tax=Actinomadura sp. SCN-SB TaxID=3373092 RepID=UPI00375300A9
MTGQQQVRRYPSQQPRLDLDPMFAQLRHSEPVTRMRFPTGQEAWLVTGYQHARRVLSDPIFSRAEATSSVIGPPEANLTAMDPPEHTRIRRLVVGPFTRRRIERWRPRTQQITDELLEAMIDGGAPADVVEGLAFPLPVTVICELLGVPPGDRQQFGAWADAFLATTAFTPQQITGARQALADYLAGLIAQRRQHPRDDLLSTLIRARDVDGALSETELVNLGVGLLVAGYETTANQITNLTFTLLTHPEQLQRLRHHPDQLPSAIEELLRFVPLGADAGMPRVATQDVQLGGVLIRAGDTVYVARPAANRDEGVFPHGETLDLSRDPQVPHLAFGYGIHLCLGAHLARMELQVALGTLLARLPGLRLAIPADRLRWKTGLLVRGLTELPICWEAS